MKRRWLECKKSWQGSWKPSRKGLKQRPLNARPAPANSSAFERESTYRARRNISGFGGAKF